MDRIGSSAEIDSVLLDPVTMGPVAVDVAPKAGRWWHVADRVGATASFLCAIHCALLPFVLTLLPLLGLGRRLVRPEVLARCRSRVEPGIADSELLGGIGYLLDLPAAVGVGEVRHPVRAHAPGVANR